MPANNDCCRFCSTPLTHTFADLGMSPVSNAYVKPDDANNMERFYPLHAFVCEACYLVQLGEFQSPQEIFSDYAYFSSYSDSWLAHAKKYAEKMIDRFALNQASQVIELASNDGYLLKNFVARGIPVLGVEPAANVAEVANKAGVPTVSRFFGVETAKWLLAEGKQADLMAANNVLAHVPDLNDFVAGIKLVLKPEGVITVEFPHLQRLYENNQFDTIYHEHFSYFSLVTVDKVFAHHGMKIFDVEELASHGGSLRIYATHSDCAQHAVSGAVTDLLQREEELGYTRLATYHAFAEKVKETKRSLLEFLIKVKRNGETVAGYGAPAKGNTLLNYCGIRQDFVDYTVDRSPHKQGSLLPGVHIPVYAPEKIAQTKPDYVLILPWNLEAEIVEQMAHIRDWGGQFIVPIPTVKVV